MSKIANYYFYLLKSFSGFLSLKTIPANLLRFRSDLKLSFTWYSFGETKGCCFADFLADLCCTGLKGGSLVGLSLKVKEKVSLVNLGDANGELIVGSSSESVVGILILLSIIKFMCL